MISMLTCKCVLPGVFDAVIPTAAGPPKALRCGCSAARFTFARMVDAPKHKLPALHPVPEVHSLADLNRWAEHNLAVTSEFLTRHNSGLEEVASAARRITLSTSFSGIGAPEQAHSASGVAMSAFLGRLVSPGRHFFAIEVDQECQYELQMAPVSPECIFCNMLDSIAPKVRQTIVSNSNIISYEDMRRIFANPRVMTDRMPCAKHSKACEVKRAQLHVAGTECIAWSAQGQRQGVNDPRVVIFMAWIGQRRQIQEEIILHENVPQFPLSCMQQLLGDLYVVSEELSVVLNARDFGNPYERSRRWTLSTRGPCSSRL